MNKTDYMELLDKEPDMIPLSDADIKEWLDDLVDAIILANSKYYSLFYGKLNAEEGEYENEIYLCNADHLITNIHVYKGIEKIAKILNITLAVMDDHSDKYPYEYSLIYRGIKIFQIEQEKLGGVDVDRSNN